jgi:hypothetical protein
VKRTLIIAAVILSMLVYALPVTASPIDTYIDGPWMRFMFAAPGSDATGDCVGCSAGPTDPIVDIEQPPWTFTLTGLADLRITDAFIRGDSFTVFDFGNPVLTTPYKEPGSISECADPDVCYGLSGFSFGSLVLISGAHSLTIQVVNSPYNSGAAFFRIDNIISTPEPLSLVFLGLGLLGLGVLRRSRC